MIHDFLVQLKRYYPAEYAVLPEEIQARYWSDDVGNSLMRTLHYGNRQATMDEQIGYDMIRLIDRFQSNTAISNGTKYKIMNRVLGEQFVGRDQPQLNPNPGGKVLVNPSDPDAEISHRCTGYQVQIMQTYGDGNTVQMITNVLPQGASASDHDSLKPWWTSPSLWTANRQRCLPTPVMAPTPTSVARRNMTSVVWLL